MIYNEVYREVYGVARKILNDDLNGVSNHEIAKRIANAVVFSEAKLDTPQVSQDDPSCEKMNRDLYDADRAFARTRQDALGSTQSASGGKVRSFPTGATRSSAEGKPDYEGYLSPLVVKRYGQFMMKHQTQADGTPRASDNWQRGMPLETFIKSGFRHFVAWWLNHRKWSADEDVEEALCALIFNASGYLHEVLKVKEM